METLQQVLGIDSATNFTKEVSDPFLSFLEHSKISGLQVNNSVLNELQELENKHKQVQKCVEEVLPPLKDYFDGLNDQLVSLTRDLSFIRGKSSELSDLLQENSSKLADISPLVNDLIISPDVISQILHGKINSQWVENIAYIKDKTEIYEKYRDSNDVPSDFGKLSNLLNLLRSMLLERSKRYIVSRIKLLRDFHTVPSQKIQSELLEVREIFQFIAENNYSLALELRQAYAYTMRWYYNQYFGRYMRSLTILQYVSIDSNFALGHGLTSTSVGSKDAFGISSYLLGGYKRPLLGSFAVTDEAINDYFQIDQRLSVLTQEDNTVMVSQIAENNHVPNYLEIGFKNLNLAILDNCAVEFMFLNDFFQANDNIEDLRGILEQIFQPTFDGSMEYTKQLIYNTYDIFGVLMSIRIAHHLQFEAQRRQIPVIDEFLDGQLILLWPKFQQLVDFQCESLRSFPITITVAKLPGRADNDPSTTPHELTVQFAKFLTSILTLSITHKELIDERSEPLYNSILRIRNDFETVMTKCSKKTKHAERFLAVNYIYLLNALQQRHLDFQGDDGSEEKAPIIFEETKEHLNVLVEAFSKVT
ncbi:LAFE_0E02146g1_1 [Lachancea fermentati]|uniref:LAFE_0E02146g1_1 n=1 Tax=Lachancea fermentati TaxID=4955 RepID=A0A1G4MCP9_LACFM|nr:LAFE_0E02146g1_1 [Lachancea fermentati]